jgi:long-chain acyl-CoA synthetase
MLENLGQVLPVAAQTYGDKTALVIGGRSFSFNDLNDLSGRLANGLHELGIAAGDRVTLYAQNCWEWIVSYYAIARLGAVVNPINVMLTPEEALYMVKDCGARAFWRHRPRENHSSTSKVTHRLRKSSCSVTTCR